MIFLTQSFFLVALVDDRLQTPCNKSGKHHCRCEEEDTSPPSPTIRSNGERKRRRSLPCGPAENSCVTIQPMPLPSLQESTPQETKDNSNSSLRGPTDVTNNRSATFLQSRPENTDEVRTRNNLNSDHLERCFKTQLNIEEREGNLEKRYKRTLEVPEIANSKTNANKIEASYNNCIKSSINSSKGSNSSLESKNAGLKSGLLENFAPFTPPSSWFFVTSWQNSNMNSKFQSFRNIKETRFNDSERVYKSQITKDTNIAIDPYAQPNPFHEPNPGPSTYNNVYCRNIDNLACTVHQSCFKNVNKTARETVSAGQDALEINNKEDNTIKSRGKAGKELSQFISKLSFPDEKDKREEGGFLDWFSKVPGRVLGVTATRGYVDNSKMKSGPKQPDHHRSTNEIKFKSCNLELSQREVDEVLAVLRARTPSGRRRTTVKNVKRRERFEKLGEDIPAGEKLLLKCASSESSNVAANRIKSCESCGHKSCKRIDHQVPSGQRSSTVLDQIYYDKNIYQPSYSKLVRSNRLNEDLQAGVCTNEDTDRLRNVCTKADVLLGAILRTSKDRKNLLDVSNGTRPRSTNITDDDSDDSHASLEKFNQDHHRIASFNDERSLPLAKRFNRFRQLFKKEEDRRNTVTEDSCSSSEEHLPSATQCSSSRSFRYNNEQPTNLHNARSKVKRRIDFSNFPEVTEEKDEMIPGLNTKDAHQKPLTQSTNSDDCKSDFAGLNQQNHCDRLLEDANEHSENEERGDNMRDIAVPKKNLTTIITSQSGHLSSKARNNNNHKDGIVDDEETVDKSVPSALEQERFRRSLENAASMVFHSRTGLPLTSSPAPLRRGSCCFDYDSSLNSVSSKRRYETKRYRFAYNRVYYSVIMVPRAVTCLTRHNLMF